MCNISKILSQPVYFLLSCVKVQILNLDLVVCLFLLEGFDKFIGS